MVGEHLWSLPSFDHPADQRSRAEARRKCRRNNQHRVTLDALAGVIQKLFRSIAALFCGTPRYSNAVVNCVGNRARRTGSLVGRFRDVIGRSFQNSL